MIPCIVIVLLLDVAAPTETIPVTFYGFHAPHESKNIVFNGGCLDNFQYNLSKSRINNDQTWIMNINLPITCSSGTIRFRWSTEPDTKWEYWQTENYREIPIHVLKEGSTAGYTIYGHKKGRGEIKIHQFMFWYKD